jgi:DNA replication and repair protein RecF
LAQFNLKKQSGVKAILLFDDIFRWKSRWKIIEMVNSDTFGQLFISDTHPGTEAIVKSTHQSYKIFNL